MAGARCGRLEQRPGTLAALDVLFSLPVKSLLLLHAFYMTPESLSMLITRERLRSVSASGEDGAWWLGNDAPYRETTSLNREGAG